MFRRMILAVALAGAACTSTPPAQQTSQAAAPATCPTAEDGTAACPPASATAETYPKRVSRYSK
jgi:hypothetical protein